MRLLRTGPWQPGHEKLELIEESGRDVPDYAILSHTWGSDEVLYEHVRDGTSHRHEAYSKVVNAVQQAASDGFEYIWIDSCCIDKSSSAELSEALNSMYTWYQRADICYAFLEDVPERTTNDFPSRFAKSRWFTRGWTLQELLAPIHIDFFGSEKSGNWTLLGNSVTLQAQISKTTSIEVDYLSGLKNVHDASIAKRMSWAAGRDTKREEDIAYCLLGLFSINMPMLYGEGSRAFLRLQEEIIKRSDDQSIFAWMECPADDLSDTDEGQSGSSDTDWSITQWITGRSKPKLTTNRKVRSITTAMTTMATGHGLLADSPSAFAHSCNFVPSRIIRKQQRPYQISNRGLHITLPIIRYNNGNLCRALLECRDESRWDNRFLGVHLTKTNTGSDQYTRIRCETLIDDLSAADCSWAELFVRQALINEVSEKPASCVLLRSISCQEGSEYVLAQIVLFNGYNGELETKVIYSREALQAHSEKPAPQCTVLEVSRVPDGHPFTMLKLVRRCDGKQLVLLLGLIAPAGSTAHRRLGFAMGSEALPSNEKDASHTNTPSVFFQPVNFELSLNFRTRDDEFVTVMAQANVKIGKSARKGAAVDIRICSSSSNKTT